MRKRQKKRFDHGDPIAKIDTRPLAFVAMFLAIVFLMPAAQVRPHSFHIDLWDGETAHPLIAGSDERAKGQFPFVNHVMISSDGMLFWNDEFITEGQLLTLLREVQLLSEQGIIEYEPHPTASYDSAVKTLYILQNSGAPLRIVGMEEHCIFNGGADRRRAYKPSTAELMRSGRFEGWAFFEKDIDWDAKNVRGCPPVGAVHAPG